MVPQHVFHHPAIRESQNNHLLFINFIPKSLQPWNKYVATTFPLPFDICGSRRLTFNVVSLIRAEMINWFHSGPFLGWLVALIWLSDF